MYNFREEYAYVSSKSKCEKITDGKYVCSYCGKSMYKDLKLNGYSNLCELSCDCEGSNLEIELNESELDYYLTTKEKRVRLGKLEERMEPLISAMKGESCVVKIDKEEIKIDSIPDNKLKNVVYCVVTFIFGIVVGLAWV